MTQETELILKQIETLGTDLRQKMAEMKTELRQEMTERATGLRQEIRDGDAATRLILENELIPQIRIIAESYFELNRKLDDIRAEMKKNELLPVRVSVLERDVRKIKEKLAMSV